MPIQTPHLTLKKLTHQDKHNMLRLHSNPEVQHYTGEDLITTEEGIIDKINEKIKDYEEYGYGRWAVFLKEGNQFVGWAGLAYLWEFDEIDIGYRFLPEFWGRGYATEVSEAILDYGFEELGLKRIIAIAVKDNLASIRVMQKVGMQFEKEFYYDDVDKEVIQYWCDGEMIRKFKAERASD